VDLYEDSFSKIALTLTATQVAKGHIVKEDGIGEELAFNFFAWRDSVPKICAQLDTQYMKEVPGERFLRCVDLVKMFRLKLGMDAVTFIAEGYVSNEKHEKPLPEAFVENDPDVHECLTIMHCEMRPGSDTPDIYLFAMPYEYKIGREVIWGNLRSFSQNAAEVVSTYSYPKMLYTVLKYPCGEPVDNLDEEMVELLLSTGFHIQEF